MKSSIFNQVLALATMNLARANDDWWNQEAGHQCYNPQPCEDSSFYFNELACECFKIETCDTLECDFDLGRDPRQECACTHEPPVYPDWATEDDKKRYANVGIARAADRPASDNWAEAWKLYPKEDYPDEVSQCYM